MKLLCFSLFCWFQTDGIPSQYPPEVKGASLAFIIPQSLKASYCKGYLIKGQKNAQNPEECIARNFGRNCASRASYMCKNNSADSGSQMCVTPSQSFCMLRVGNQSGKYSDRQAQPHFFLFKFKWNTLEAICSNDLENEWYNWFVTHLNCLLQYSSSNNYFAKRARRL